MFIRYSVMMKNKIVISEVDKLTGLNQEIMEIRCDFLKVLLSLTVVFDK